MDFFDGQEIIKKRGENPWTLEEPSMSYSGCLKEIIDK
ncbi:hypothetical protein PMIT1342_00876 [Prochlorococcus marinus str. MIT 1342]|nr:hypothetical protein PMIT1303_01220 [Prochlorococcus sp. MIT 1303]KZR82406.1 hypothetical protein PMIT1342_00876 [Prochlorococcus marinus str. MIT 1342]